MNQRSISLQCGFTLIEAVMVIVITGIIAGMVAVFIRSPIDAYVDSARRAVITDIADTAARRIARDLQSALPNSVRVDGTGQFLEFIPIRDAGRYRAEVGTAAADNPLDFTNTADNSFDVLGPPVTVSAGDSVVVYNLGIAGASDAYDMPTLTSRRVVTAGGAIVAFTATTAPLPFSSPGSRFQIVGTPICYVCAGGRLLRYSGYGFPNPSTATATTTFGATVPAVLATNVANCFFSYAPGPLQHNGLVSTLLTITQSGESVTLQSQINVDNVP